MPTKEELWQQASRDVAERKSVGSAPGSARAPRATLSKNSFETGLLRNRVAGAKKDGELIRTTLAALDWFEGIQEPGMAALVEAMDVFDFDDGEDAVRQGDSGCTFFFVVASGSFAVLQGANFLAELGAGQHFGESVLLLYGERTATVRASGRARAYGMQADAVRRVLRRQYEDLRGAVIAAVDMALGAGCAVLRELTPYQLQCLHDRGELAVFGEGDVVFRQGGHGADGVYILLEGPLALRVDNEELRRVEDFELVGDAAMLFQETPATVVAGGPVRMLNLSRSLLEDVFGDRLTQRLLTARMASIFARHRVLSRLSGDQREAVAANCQLWTLAPGEEIEASKRQDLRLVVCLHGDVEIWPITNATGGRMSSRPATLCRGVAHDVIGEDFLLRQGVPWSIRVRAVDAVRLAVVAGREVDRNLALDEKDRIEALRRVIIFRTLSVAQLQQLCSALHVWHVGAGERVFSQGEMGTDMFIIHSGQLEITIDGRRIRTLGIGDYVGERALLSSTPRSATVAAVEDSELWKMDKETFQHIVHGRILDHMKERIDLQNTKIELEDLDILRVVGKGGFGTVQMVQCSRTQVRYALKCVPKHEVVKRKMQDALNLERSILSELDHPFVIKYVRSFKTEANIYLLMELVTGGELLDALEALGLLNQGQAQFYMGSIALALEFLHLRRIVYLDLKGENVLVDQHGYIKIIDFGIAERVSHGRCYVVKGTPSYMAPEVIRGEGYATAADFWSLGVCLYEFMVGRMPFADGETSHVKIFNAVLKAPIRFPEWLDAPDAKALIRGLLSRDPVKRPGAGSEGYATLKGHAFFGGFEWDGLLGRELEPPFVPQRETYAEGEEVEDTSHKRSSVSSSKDNRKRSSTFDIWTPSSDERSQAPAVAPRRRLLSMAEQEAKASAERGSVVWQDPDPGWDADF